MPVTGASPPVKDGGWNAKILEEVVKEFEVESVTMVVDISVVSEVETPVVELPVVVSCSELEAVEELDCLSSLTVTKTPPAIRMMTRMVASRYERELKLTNLTSSSSHP